MLGINLSPGNKNQTFVIDFIHFELMMLNFIKTKQLQNKF